MKQKLFALIAASLLVHSNLCGAVDDSASSRAKAETNQGKNAATAEATKPCFNCNGAGKTKCRVPSCKNGQMDCPGPCMKLSRGSWVHKNVAGHDPSELWQEFRGQRGTMAWNQNHAGEVVHMQNGEPVNIGKCTVCGGTTRIKCSACQGTGEAACDMCGGKKIVPVSWSAFDNPKMKNRPTDIHLKDGRVIRGRITMQVGGTAWITTKDAEKVEVKSSDIISK